MATRRAHLLCGLASALLLALPAPALGLEQVPNLGVYVSYAFGPRHGVGWGIFGSDLMLVRGTKSCSNMGDTPTIGVGPVLRVGFRGLGHPRVSLSVGAGVDPAPQSLLLEGVIAEGGLTLPMGDGRVAPHGGLTVSGPILSAFFMTDPGIGEHSTIGIGGQFPGFLHYPDMCLE